MRATYLLQTGIFAFLTVSATPSYLYMYVADDSKSNVQVAGQFEVPIQHTSYTSDDNNKCLNKTETSLIYFESPECKNQPIYAYITMVSLEVVNNEPQHLDIIMPKYNLSVRHKTTLATLELIL